MVPKDKDIWQLVCNSVKKISKETTEQREFTFKFLHRIIVTRKELFRYGIKTDDECLYCGEPESIDHGYIYGQFIQQFAKKIVQWFNEDKKCNFNPRLRESCLEFVTRETNLLKSLVILCYFCGSIFINVN